MSACNKSLQTTVLGFGLALLLMSVTGAEAIIRWASFRSNALSLQVTVPQDWAPVKMPGALAFRYDDQAGGTAAIGFLKSKETDRPIEDQATAEIRREGNPANWTKSSASVAGMPAIKILGNSTKDPTRRIVHYYVQAPSGVYLVQCQASLDRWATFSPIFTKILSRVRFLA